MIFTGVQRSKRGDEPRLESAHLSVLTLSNFLKTPGACWNWEAELFDNCQEENKKGETAKKLNNTKG